MSWRGPDHLRAMASPRRTGHDLEVAGELFRDALVATVTDIAQVVGLLALAVAAVGLALGAVRVVGRRRWRYRRYAIAPYRTDDASAEEVLALFQDWHQELQQRLHRRLLFGQPYFALEEHVRPTDGGPELSLTLVCPEQFVSAFDGRLAATYAHSRVGHGFTRRFDPLSLEIAWNRAVVRLRKRRPFTATVKTHTEAHGQSVIEAELAAMAASGQAMTVQKVFTPIFPSFERVARCLYRRRERTVDRYRQAPLGPASPLAQADLRAAVDAQHQLLFWLEVRVVADAHEACRLVAGAIAGRRQENILHQRNTPLSRGLHRRRVPAARPELIPSWRYGVVSAAEAATLWQLPSPKFGHVRLARHTVPRAPAPPDVARAPLALDPAAGHPDGHELPVANPPSPETT
jgi:hypothetical protein